MIGAKVRPDQMRFRSVGRTHVGRVRSVNEDRIVALDAQGLWAIADGMGGHSNGGDAATAVVRALSAIAADGQIRVGPISGALCQVSASIAAAAAANDSVCGSTVAGMILTDGGCGIFWVGDSRVYRLRSGKLEQLTRDHSLVQELVDEGVLTSEQARTHPRAAVITRAVGVGTRLDVEWAETRVDADDCFLLCSDGLSDMLDHATIAHCMAEPFDDRAAALIAAALDAGGTDNISVIVVGAALAPPGLATIA